MVPYHNPIPERKQRGEAEVNPAPDKSNDGLSGGGLIGAWIQAEKMIQIALVLPCAAFIGWLPGVWLDRHFHQTWMAMAGVVFGIVAGLVTAIRMAVVYANDPAMDKLDENGNDAGKSGKTGDSGTAS
jgi:F0F1-type ATP synthase assembly protein I